MRLVRKLIGYMPRKKTYSPPGAELFDVISPTVQDWSLDADLTLSDRDIEQLCHAV